MIRHRSLRSLVHSVAFACFSMGFNTGIIAGGLLYLDAHFIEIQENPVLKGAVTASVFFSAFLANIFVAALADCCGRLFLLRFMNVPFLLGAMVVATASTPSLIIVGRFITGFAVGIAGTLPNLYIAEIVSPESRGRFVGMAPLYGTFGIMIAQFFSLLVAAVVGHEACCAFGWRIMFGAGAVPAVVQAVWTARIPESPRWCSQRGHTERAIECRDYIANLAGGAGIQDTQGSEAAEQLSLHNAAIAVGLSVMQQLSGVNAVIFYAPHIYAQLGVRDTLAILVAGCNSVAQVAMTRVMTKIVDSWGRRPICFFGLIGMLIGLVMLGEVFEQAFTELPVGFAVIGILIFRLSFSLSLGPLPYIMVTELFPQRQRAQGAALSMMTNWFLNWGVVFMVPELMRQFQGAVFFAFAGVCAISMVVVDLGLPETAGRDLGDTSSFGSRMSKSYLMRACLFVVHLFRRKRATEAASLLRERRQADATAAEAGDLPCSSFTSVEGQRRQT